MCGIAASVRQAGVCGQTLMDMLASLEYRGYDSSGFCGITSNHHMVLEKGTESVAELRSKSKFEPRVLCAIAHTRWATHGEASYKNAHPHQALGRFALVHNGVIDNYNSLKKELEQKITVPWGSDTDSEVILQWVAYRVSQKGEAVDIALDKVMKTVTGTFAVVLVDRMSPGVLYAVCGQSPLIIGKNVDGVDLASDAQALGHCEEVASLPDNHVFKIESQVMSSIGLLSWKKPPHKDPKPVAMLGKNTPVTFREISSQAQIIRNLTQKIQNNISIYNQARALIEASKQCVFVACGSSFYASEVAAHWFENILQKPCRVQLANEYAHNDPLILSDTLLLALSQSGETMDVLLAVRRFRAQLAPGNRVLSVCNREDSSLAKCSDLTLNCHAGPEIGVATTKVFSCQLWIFLQLIEPSVTKHMRERYFYGNTCAVLNQALGMSQKVKLFSSVISSANSMFYLGRGVGYYLAKEGALKIKELSYIHAEAYAAGELKHGPLALICEGFFTVLLIDSKNLLSKMVTCAQEVTSRGGRLILVGDHEAAKVITHSLSQRSRDEVILLTNEAVFSEPAWCFYVITVMQLLAYHVASCKGCNVDRPRNLAKCVTV